MLDTLPDTKNAQVAAWCSIAQARADALGNCVEQGLPAIAIEPSVQRCRAKEISKAFATQPLNGRIPAHDGCAEQPAGVIDESPTHVRGTDVVLEWRMTPTGVSGEEPL